MATLFDDIVNSYVYSSYDARVEQIQAIDNLMRIYNERDSLDL